MAGPWVLCVGGTDPSGAGLDADREAVAAAGPEVAFVGVPTAHTDQDDRGLRDLGAREDWAWRYDALAAGAVTNPVAIKFGLLPGAAHLAAAAGVVDQYAFEAPGVPVVLDPVLRASSGAVFVRDDELDAVRTLCRRPLVLTPNVPEAAALAGVDPGQVAEDLGARLAAAARLLRLGLAAVVLKGGHGGEAPLRDLVLARGAEPTWIERSRRPGPGIRGSGCRFASFLATRLGLGDPLEVAARGAGEYVAGRIAAASEAP